MLLFKKDESAPDGNQDDGRYDRFDDIPRDEGEEADGQGGG
jgi:hypothetical protein